MRSSKKSPSKGKIILGILGGCMAVLVATCEIAGRNYVPEPTPYEAFSASREAVTNRLRAPSTADFCSRSEARCSQVGDDYYCELWVDAQNSFGAMIRERYRVRLQWSDPAKRFIPMEVTVVR